MATVIVYLDRENLRGTHRSRHGYGKQPDRAASCDRDGLGGNFSGEHRVNSIA